MRVAMCMCCYMCALCCYVCVGVGAAPTVRRAIKIGGSSVRYDVAREVFLIRATTLEDVEESKGMIGSKMAMHGFQLEIAGAASTPPAHAAPTPLGVGDIIQASYAHVNHSIICRHVCT